MLLIRDQRSLIDSRELAKRVSLLTESAWSTSEAQTMLALGERITRRVSKAAQESEASYEVRQRASRERREQRAKHAGCARIDAHEGCNSI